MWKKPIASVFAIGILMTGCNTEEAQENSKQNNVYDPLETTEKNNDTESNELRRGAPNRIKREAEEDMRNTTYNMSDRAHNNEYYNEQSMAITRSINELPQVSTSTAFATEDRVLVGVVPTIYGRKDHNLKNLVREKVAEVTEEKNVVIYMNHSDWEELRDLNARVRAEKAPEKVKGEINKFLKRFQPDNSK
ncbi:Sporulation lipoprotein YhcN/YlaJ (Spore_YhcN_YlaJ) [Thalassobacillus cyri]|uniref:Sporulation lipoprotein YhcN/YlaJ (Spore_YhcN_YlaJ) n=1 Tax=Thalassobacillus cyri TaxID=571932 RepID=A0A1H4FDP2_9BACI|nr:YhcN/YlaJ family sporulation lipoprotein [Thalassobacillus cyri]SEA94602.1 Sporulation lipoprotein YhcN/YlaJ (Spore_YhcN_YlaJ) [Thalassobacillus cyri]